MTGTARLSDRVCQLMPQWQRHDLGDFSYLPLGYSNANYHFRHLHQRYVLRLPIGARQPSTWRSERAFYERPGKILIPKIMTFDVDTGAMISRWVDGPLMIDAPPAHDRLVAFLRTLHANLATTDSNYDPIARSLQYLATPGPSRISPRVRRLAALSTWPHAQPVTCHNDFNPWNVICASHDQWVTLDWESRGNNDPLFDLVTMHQGLGLNDNLLPAMCDNLLGEPALPHRVEQVLIGFWIREYAWAFSQWQRGNHRDELHAQMRLAEDKLIAFDR